VWIQLTIGGVIMAAALVGLALFHRHLRGEGSSLFSGRKAPEPKADAGDLEAFIAAYRRDKAASGQPAAAVVANPAVATPAAAPVPVLAAAPTPGKPPGPFLQGPAKVLFLVLKAALPDHHVFVYARLTDVIKPIGKPLTPQGRAQFAQSRMDFVVCNKTLNVVALLDISDGTRPDDPIKQHLQPQLAAAGIRYVRVATDALPKPAEVKQLVYPAAPAHQEPHLNHGGHGGHGGTPVPVRTENQQPPTA
jgi:hypothetical protein